MTTNRPCPLCGSADFSKLYAEERIDQKQLGEFAYASRKIPEYMHLRLMHCSSCDLVYASPVPEMTDLQNAYEAAAYDSQVEAKYAAKTYADQIRSFISRLPDRIGALDIGAGDGAFCSNLKQLNFSEIIGLEPSSAPIAAAEPDVRQCMRQEMFVPGLFSEAQFSLVTCFQTIEHVPNPRDLCHEAVRLLKPGGALCLVGHNRRAMSNRLMGRRSPIFDIEHLQLFSPTSFRRLLEDAGLVDIVVRPIYNKYPVAYWTKLLPFPKMLKQLLLGGLNVTRIGLFPVTIPAGNIVAFGFRKKA